jgi:transforming growth factor-beta-induced protein
LQVRITPTGTKTVAIDATLEITKGSIQTVVAADAVGGGAPLGAYVVDELKGDAPAPKSIVEIALANPDFSSLVGALKSANLVEALSGAGPFTVFAPTNDAFSKLAAVPSGDALKEVLLYHVAAGKFDAKTLLKNGSVKTLQGQVVRVKRMGDKVILNDSVMVTTADIEASNGIIHVIDTVLIPPTPPKSIVEIALANPNFSTLVGALSSANLVEALSGEGPFTVFAPTNDAFSKLAAVPSGDALKEVLLYHVAAGKFDAKTLLKNGSVKTLQGQVVIVKHVGDKVILNDSVMVTTANIEASNGIIHVIDTVLIPPVAKSIVEIALANPKFSTLVGALTQAKLVEALSGAGPFTVFAPTNSAFEKLESIPDGDALKEVLLYHVVAGRFDAAALAGLSEVTTLSGKKVQVAVHGKWIVLNGHVFVIKADVNASNGVIHVIDSVLIPQ